MRYLDFCRSGAEIKMTPKKTLWKVYRFPSGFPGAETLIFRHSLSQTRMMLEFKNENRKL
jgi:hypothetical protein